MQDVPSDLVGELALRAALVRPHHELRRPVTAVPASVTDARAVASVRCDLVAADHAVAPHGRRVYPGEPQARNSASSDADLITEGGRELEQRAVRRPFISAPYISIEYSLRRYRISSSIATTVDVQ